MEGESVRLDTVETTQAEGRNRRETGLRLSGVQGI